MLHPISLKIDNTTLVIIDVQTAFRRAIPTFEMIANQIGILSNGFAILDIPIIATEQYPQKLGNTIYAIEKNLSCTPIEKITFSCTLNDSFMKKLSSLNVKTIVVCGIETHICINQTVLSLLNKGYQVHVATDAVASRKQIDYETALKKMEKAGAILTTTEMALFELIQRADNIAFKEIQKLIK